MYTPEQYGTSAHSNPHWTTGIFFVFYLFGSTSLLDTGLHRLVPTNINPLENYYDH